MVIRNIKEKHCGSDFDFLLSEFYTVLGAALPSLTRPSVASLFLRGGAFCSGLPLFSPRPSPLVGGRSSQPTKMSSFTPVRWYSSTRFTSKPSICKHTHRNTQHKRGHQHHWPTTHTPETGGSLNTCKKTRSCYVLPAYWECVRCFAVIYVHNNDKWGYWKVQSHHCTPTFHCAAESSNSNYKAMTTRVNFQW